MKEVIPLSSVKPGTVVRVVGFERRGLHFLRRVQEMGVLEGEIIEVERNSGLGPVQLKVKGTHLALGRGISLKILVEIQDEKKEP